MRAVAVLALTEILAWGILIYPPVLTMPQVAAAHGWSLAYSMAGFSVGLVVSGILSPIVCGLIDRHGGNIVMGALAGSLGLALLVIANRRFSDRAVLEMGIFGALLALGVFPGDQAKNVPSLR